MRFKPLKSLGLILSLSKDEAKNSAFFSILQDAPRGGLCASTAMILQAICKSGVAAIRATGQAKRPFIVVTLLMSRQQAPQKRRHA
jgi:hypothetical protein